MNYELHFGKGGYKGKERQYIDTVIADKDVVMKLAENLRDVGYWTVVRKANNEG